jgi:polysaccharide export outer membrane protein
VIAFWTLILAFFNMSNALSQDYMLGNGDILDIEVYEHPDLKTTVRISGNGMITLPLIGQVEAANSTVKELSKKVETILADGYVVDPQVNIFIKEFRSQKATILGEVKSPGLYEMEGYTSLLELISTAGGLTENASIEVVIHRKELANQKEQTINIDLRQLMEEGQNSKNIQVIDGDNIFIPKKKVFYVTGEVKKPNSYNYEDGLTVIQALTMAGGISEKAAPNRVKIIRTSNGNEQLIKGVKMDQSVKPNDVIVVPESYF